MSKVVLQCENVSKTYGEGEGALSILRGITFELCAGDSVAIVGSSGSGKSTLLYVLSGLDEVSSGTVMIDGQCWSKMNTNQRAKQRNQHLGFVYQRHHLLPEFSAWENVAMPLWLQGREVKTAREKAHEMLSYVGLEARAAHRPGTLSGGERQRVALARALVTEPSCVLADEPTGNLDQDTAQSVLDVMLDLKVRCQTALVVVTHDLAIAHAMEKTLQLDHGQLLAQR